MLDLEKSERIVIVILVSGLLVGLAILGYKRYHSPTVDIQRFQPNFQDVVSLEKYARANKERININAATVESIARLKGIGRVLAGKIVSYRSSHGYFTSVEDIKKVKGVGNSVFEKIKDDIIV